MWYPLSSIDLIASLYFNNLLYVIVYERVELSLSQERHYENTDVLPVVYWCEEPVRKHYQTKYSTTHRLIQIKDLFIIFKNEGSEFIYLNFLYSCSTLCYDVWPLVAYAYISINNPCLQACSLACETKISCTWCNC